MPKLVRTTDVAEPLKPYVFHGLDLQPSGDEAIGDCPFCGREGKFTVNVVSGQYRCLICGDGVGGEGGNATTYIRNFYDMAFATTQQVAYEELAATRGYDSWQAIKDWGLAVNPLNKRWLVPGWGTDLHGKLQLQQLYAYTFVKDRKMLLPIANFKHCLLGVPLFDPKRSEVYVAEGIWDAIRLYEVLRTTKLSANKFVSTSSLESSLAADINVVAAPTCSSFSETWTRWFKDKTVYFLFDSDHPRTHPTTGDIMPPAGYEGMRRATAKVASVATAVHYLAWGSEGYDPQLKEGYDLSDALRNKQTGLDLIFGRTEPVPSEWLQPTSTTLECRPCKDWNTLINSWRKALKWTDGLEHALACMLATVVSTRFIGDQLWMKIIGPASCGKSTLCEALSVNKKFVFAKSNIRGFHSGYKTSDDTREDNSLIPSITGKTLVTKDGDTLLQTPGLGQILSEARDLYDSVSRTHYRNRMGKDYENVRMTWLLCGTSSLRQIDESELGERFLDCVVLENIDPDMEDDILWRVVHRAADNMNFEANGEATSHYSPELCEAMQLTGGYISWLCDNAAQIMPTIEFPPESKQQCIHIGKFVAYMRARPSKRQTERAERELAARLVSQHTRLAKCLAMVLNKPSVDPAVVARVKRVGLDTSRGAVLDLVRQIWRGGNVGISSNGLHVYVNLGQADLHRLLRFDYRIGVLHLVKKPAANVWQLTEPLIELCKELL